MTSQSKFTQTLPATQWPNRLNAPPVKRPRPSFPNRNIVREAISAPQAVVEEQPAGAQKAAFVLLCIYIVSNLANDWTLRLFGARAFLSLIAGVILPIACLVGGSGFRGLKSPIGRYWMMFLAWTVIAIPFSTWLGGTFAVVQEFLTKNAPLFFYITASALNIDQCRKLFYVNIFGGFAVIVSCGLFGDGSSGRLMIPGSIFFDNSNDLALQLLISAAFIAFLLLSGGKAGKVLGGILFCAALLYAFKTASRANFLSLGVCFIATLVIFRHRIRLLLLFAVLAVIAIAVIPGEQWTRMVYVVLDTSASQAASLNDGTELNGDLESQLERTDRLKRSIAETLTHPVFGLGAGQFGNVVWAEMKAKGLHDPSLGTHNTYTQVSSELGIPALILYLMVLVGCLNQNRRLYKQAAQQPELKDIASMALCLYMALMAYSCSTFFHHVAYSRQLPTLAGMTIALSMAAARHMSPVPGRRAGVHA